MDLRLLHKIFPWVSAAIITLFCIFSVPYMVEWNNEEEYQVVEYPNGTIRVIDTTGFHLQLFGEVFTYPRYIDTHFATPAAGVDGEEELDSSIRVTYNDGGWGQTSSHLKFQMPVTETERIELHRHFGNGEEDSVTDAVGHHLRNCLKNAGPLMSGSEHQAQRRAEFYQAVLDQLQNGLYVMERVEQRIDRGIDRTLSNEPETQYATKIRRDKDGKPVWSAPSPLSEYGITVIQYNLTNTVYDADTLAQINAKRESYQLAEQAKAATLNEQQKLLEVIEKGKLAVASIEAEENKAKKKTLVEAEQEQDVARISQAEEVTKAEQQVVVAGEQLKKANTQLEISLIKIETAQAEGEKLISESEATQAKLNQGGALSERDKTMAELKQQRNAAIATAISQIPAPRIAILGGSGGGETGSGSATTETLMNLLMLQQLKSEKE